MLDWDKLFGQLAAVSSAPIPFLVALLIVAGFILWAIDWRYSTVLGHRDAEISRLKGERDDNKTRLSGAIPDQAKAKTETPPASLTAAGLLIKNPAIERDDKGDIWLTGTYEKSGKELVAYVTVFLASTFNNFVGLTRDVALPPATIVGSEKIEVSRPGRFDKDARARIKIGSINQENGDWVLQWGEPSRQHRSGASYSGFFGVIFLVDADHQEYTYSFAIVSRKTDLKNFPPPVIIGPDVYLLQAGMLPEVRK